MTQATLAPGAPVREPGAGPDARARRTARRRRALHWIAVHSLGIAAAAFFVLPFVFVLLTALMSDNQALTRDLWPHPFAVVQLPYRLGHPGLPDLVAQHPGVRRAPAPC